MQARNLRADPLGEAREHLGHLLDALGSNHGVDVCKLANARPQWPVWPQRALSVLVGPTSRIAAQLDLRWLHRFEATTILLGSLTGALGGPVGGPSGLSLLVERAAIYGLQGRGALSAAGSCRLIRASDGWITFNLASFTDIDKIAGWLQMSVAEDVVGQTDTVVSHSNVEQLVESAKWFGLPVARVPELGDSPNVEAPLTIRRGGRWSAKDSSPLVLDLSSFWAGPLCGWYLARAGARVIKVEPAMSRQRSRVGTLFYDRLNGAKDFQLLEAERSESVGPLNELISQADVVIHTPYPYAIRSLGVDVPDCVDGGKIWCSITAFGADGLSPNRIELGDDAAAAGGLVTFVDGEPWFIGDAAGEPIAGVVAALGVLSLWADRSSGVVEVAMKSAVGCLTGAVPVPSRF